MYVAGLIFGVVSCFKAVPIFGVMYVRGVAGRRKGHGARFCLLDT